MTKLGLSRTLISRPAWTPLQHAACEENGMSELSIDSDARRVLGRAPVPNTEIIAKKYAEGLPAWHPVRQLFSGETAWMRRSRWIYVCLRLLSDVHAEDLLRAEKIGFFRSAAATDAAGFGEPPDTFMRAVLFQDIIFEGRLQHLANWHYNARLTAESVSRQGEKMHAIALEAFDRTVSLLLRAIRSAPPPTPRERAARAAFRLHVVR